MTDPHVKEFQASVTRCLESPSFIQDFYDRFTGASGAIREMFRNTDFAHQTQAMADSLYAMAVAVHGGPDNLARLDMKRLYAKHQRMGIKPEMYDTWLDCLIATARTHDLQFSPAIERAWRKCLAPGIESMRTGRPFKT